MPPTLEVPPWIAAGAEVLLLPALQDDIVGLIKLDVLQGEGQGCRAARDGAVRGILGAVARALELVLSLVPRHDTSQMGAHGVECKVLEIGAVVVDNEVGGVALEPLDEVARARKVGLEVLGAVDVVAQGVLGDGAAAGAAARLRDKEVGERAQDAQGDGADRARQQDVHGVALGHVRDHDVLGARRGHAGAGGARGRAGRRQRGHGAPREGAARRRRRAGDEGHGVCGAGGRSGGVAGRRRREGLERGGGGARRWQDAARETDRQVWDGGGAVRSSAQRGGARRRVVLIAGAAGETGTRGSSGGSHSFSSVRRCKSWRSIALPALISF